MIRRITVKVDLLLEKITLMCEWTYDNNRCLSVIVKSIPLAIVFFAISKTLPEGWFSDSFFVAGIISVSVALVSYYSIEGNKRQSQLDSAKLTKSSCTCPYKVETPGGSGIPIPRR